MLSVNDLHGYQKKAINFQCTKPQTMLWLDMGLGKTVVTLTSISHLINTGYLKSVLIVAPIRVIRLVWKQEAVKWNQSQHLRFCMITGTRDQRTRALLQDADIYLINYENLKWLSETLTTYFIKKDRPLPFDGVVWDEISKMKNSATKRVKAVKKILPHFKWSTGLTGTPASNGYKDLHGQYLVVDKGERLGTSKTAFRHRFYRKEGPFKEVPYNDTEEIINKLVADITLEMSAEDYNPLPDIIYNNVEVQMSPQLRAQYDKMEKEFFIQLDSGVEIEMFNKATLTNKCLQFSNGAMYPVSGMPLWEPVHDMKLEALADIIDDANGQPILCSYAYRSDAERIMKRFKDLNPINLTQCKSESSLVNAMQRWQNNDCPLMIGHPACLHSRTQVLTERYGWINLIDVEKDDRVFDGVEFVNHEGCVYSGTKEVVDVFGITMTPDHKLLINGEWVEAKNVSDDKEVRREALYKYKGDDESLSQVFNLRSRDNITSSEHGEKQQEKTSSLSPLHTVHVSSQNQNKDLENLVRNEEPSGERSGQGLWKLRGSRCHHGRIMGGLQKLLQRYAPWLLGQSDTGENRQLRTLFKRKLSVGVKHGAAKQQEEQSCRRIPGGENPPCGISETKWIQQDNVTHETQQRNDWRRGCERRSKLTIRKESEEGERGTARKEKVYDLVNCGPRHRFIIRNDHGEVFISHNSMGHGVDGLQKNGHILVWFGLNWSLDLYDQFNARIRRQGQGAPVICHRITTKNTLDQAQLLALQDKATTQTSLRNSIKTYREMKGV